LFASLDDEQAERVLLATHEHHASAGEAVIEQWQVSRDLYVVWSGAVAIFVGDDRVRTLGSGEFFGELAAIDWGAGFGRTRTATVTATEPTRLLVLDWTLVNWLMTAAPAFGKRLETVSRERLAARG
jgi:CRP-like cAMP-binding protein